MFLIKGINLYEDDKQGPRWQNVDGVQRGGRRSEQNWLEKENVVESGCRNGKTAPPKASLCIQPSIMMLCKECIQDNNLESIYKCLSCNALHRLLHRSSTPSIHPFMVRRLVYRMGEGRDRGCISGIHGHDLALDPADCCCSGDQGCAAADLCRAVQQVQDPSL